MLWAIVEENRHHIGVNQETKDRAADTLPIVRLASAIQPCEPLNAYGR
jgi:hypothetical protein